MRNNILQTLAIATFACATMTLSGQVGVGTFNPVRTLDVVGSGDQMVRIKTDWSQGRAGLELVRGSQFGETYDWKLVNNEGKFMIRSSQNHFNAHTTIMTILPTGPVGIGTTNPTATMHIATGEEASKTQHGYMLIGSPSGVNMVFDKNEIISRLGEDGHSMTLQPLGGDIYMQENGGNLVMVVDSGNVTVGQTSGIQKFDILSDGWQMHLKNGQGADNDWYIGASDDTWAVGGDQLVFAPTSSSSSSKLRLKDVAENNGVQAPMEIHSAGNQALLIDGNEIDTDNGSLYFNHNSQSHTLLNPSGGQTSIGIITPQANLHVNTTPSQYALTLNANSERWNIHPYPAIQKLGFHLDDVAYSHVDVASGQWIALSDRRFKDNIQPMQSVSDRLKSLDVKTYTIGEVASSDRSIGVMAQQVQKVFPELVHEYEGNFALSYAQLAIVALKALQEQNAELDALEKELTELISLKKQASSKSN